jgi:peptidoglycan/LPS O-acetylase OafA/YrhL
MDSMRAVAALGVLVGHVGLLTQTVQTHSYGAVIGNLTAGVCLFFVLSGFLLYRPFVNAQLGGSSRPRVRDYTRRRVLRIIPAYWLALSLLAIYPGLVGLPGPDWWRYYGLMQIYEPVTTLAGIPVAWSLCIEASFYVLLPFFAIALAQATRRFAAATQVRAQLAVLGGLALGSIVLRATTDDIVLKNSLPTYFYWFALGMALAVLSVAWHGRERQPRVVRLVAERPGACWGIALVAYVAIVAVTTSAPGHAVLSDSQQMATHVLRGVLAFFLILPAVFGDGAGGFPRRVLALPWLAWLGLISYGLYLWHHEVIRFLSPRLDDAWWPVLALTLAVSIVCAAGSYYVVERPLLRFKDLRIRRRAPAEAAPRVAG